MKDDEETAIVSVRVGFVRLQQQMTTKSQWLAATKVYPSLMSIADCLYCLHFWTQPDKASLPGTGLISQWQGWGVRRAEQATL